MATFARNGFRALNVTDLFVRLPLWAVAAAMNFLVVVPTGYLAQRVVRWAAAADAEDAT
jgi:hypothetical protein